MKTTIYELLGMIKDGNAPKKIMYNKKIYEYAGDDYLYEDEDKHEYWLFSESYTETGKWLNEFLNDEVEILDEPKKINKIRIDYNSINIDKAFETGTTTFFREKDIEIFQCLSSKINELIDEVNKLKESDK